MSQWTPSMTNWGAITLEKAQFMLKEVETYFQALEDTNTRSREKAMKLSGLFITLNTGLVAFLMHLLEAKKWIPAYTIVSCTSIVLIVVFFIGLKILVPVISPRRTPAAGNEPQNLLVDTLVVQDMQQMTTGTIIGYQDRIEQMIAVNEDFAQRIERAVKIAEIAPLVGGFVLTFLVLVSV